MPISYATLQIYDQYLTTYGSKRCSRYDTHDSKELKELYSSIQLKNRFAPVYLKSPTATEISYAIQLKEQAKSLHETIDTLSCDDENQLFSTKPPIAIPPDKSVFLMIRQRLKVFLLIIKHLPTLLCQFRTMQPRSVIPPVI